MRFAKNKLLTFLLPAIISSSLIISCSSFEAKGGKVAVETKFFKKTKVVDKTQHVIGKDTHARIDKTDKDIKISGILTKDPNYISYKKGKTPTYNRNIDPNATDLGFFHYVPAEAFFRGPFGPTKETVQNIINIISFPVVGDQIEIIRKSGNGPAKINLKNQKELMELKTLNEKIDYLLGPNLLNNNYWAESTGWLGGARGDYATEKQIADFKEKAKALTPVDSHKQINGLPNKVTIPSKNPYFIWNTDKEFSSFDEPHRAYHTSPKQVMDLGNNWASRLMPIKDITRPFDAKGQGKKEDYMVHLWNANESNSILDIINQMDDYVGFYFQKPFDRMSPFELGHYLVDFYNNNGGGKIAFAMTYKGTTEIVHIDFNAILKGLIWGFDTEGGVTTNYPVGHETTAGKIATEIIEKTNQNLISGGAWLLGLFGKAGNDIFGVSNPFTMLGELPPETLRILNLVGALPGEAILKFAAIISIFSDLADLFVTSPTAQKWAKDHNLTSEFNNLYHTMVQTIMKSGHI